jgi:hypothetical protein
MRVMFELSVFGLATVALLAAGGPVAAMVFAAIARSPGSTAEAPRQERRAERALGRARDNLHTAERSAAARRLRRGARRTLSRKEETGRRWRCSTRAATQSGRTKPGSRRVTVARCRLQP